MGALDAVRSVFIGLASECYTVPFVPVNLWNSVKVLDPTVLFGCFPLIGDFFIVGIYLLGPYPLLEQVKMASVVQLGPGLQLTVLVPCLSNFFNTGIAG